MVREYLTALTLLVGLGLAAEPVLARPVNIPSTRPVASVDIPGGWTTKQSKRGIEVKSPDEEVFFWVEAYAPPERPAVVAEHEKYFDGQGVKITGEPRVSTLSDTGVKVQATSFPATWKGKPTVLRYLAIDPSLPGKEQVLLSYWASPEGDKTHDVAFKGIIESLGPPK